MRRAATLQAASAIQEGESVAPRVGKQWKESGWYYQPKTAAQVMAAIARIGTHGSNHRFAWRGLSDCNFSLTSSLHRHLISESSSPITEERLREREKQILERARQWGLGIHGAQPVDDLQLLSDLQHFGVPTRLIDVTSNPMTALWFATEPTRDSNSSRTGLLVALNMSWYCEKTGSDNRKKTVFRTVDFESKIHALSAQLEQGLSLPSPFVVGSALPNDRLRAQEGYFLASKHPDESTEPLTSLQITIKKGDPDEVRSLLTENKKRGLPKHLPFVAVFVPHDTKERLREYLRLTYNRTPRTLFPDYAGFS